MIDFTMTGLNLCLIIGIVLLLQGVCFLLMQNPFRKIRKFGVRDYILFALILCITVSGIVCTVIGAVDAFQMIL